MAMALHEDEANGGITLGGPLDPDEGLADGTITPGAIVTLSNVPGRDYVEAPPGSHGDYIAYAMENIPAPMLRLPYADGVTVRVNRARGASFAGLIAASTPPISPHERLKVSRSKGRLERWEPNVDDERLAVAKYAGTVIFVPGDVDARQPIILLSKPLR